MLGLGGISLFLTVVSSGYSLIKEIVKDLEESDKRDSNEFRKYFRKLPKSQRQKMLKKWMAEYRGKKKE